MTHTTHDRSGCGASRHRRGAAAGIVAGGLALALVAVTGRPSLAATPDPAGAQVAAAHAAAPALLVSDLHDLHGARQVVTVTASRAGSDRASLQAFALTSHGWRRYAGPWPVWIGRGGFAPQGAKHEGDGRTPSGSFAIPELFGTAPRPAGIRLPWRHAGATDYWDDDPASPRYNEWVDTAVHSAGRDPEPLDVASYRDAAVIAYNTARTPGRGSAIFLHVTHDSATSGCVALPRDRLLRLLRWLDPADHPRIVMGTTAAVTGSG